MTAPTTILEDLRRRIDAVESGSRGAATRAHITTGIIIIDAALPCGGLPPGSLVELFDANDTPCGATTLACLFAKAAAGDAGWIAWIDTNDLYPPAAVAMGIDPSRLLIISTHNPSDALWAFEQAIRSNAIAASILTLSRVPLAITRRLQLAAETGGGIGFLIRPDHEASQPSAAAARIRVAPYINDTREAIPDETDFSPLLPSRKFKITILKIRGGFPSDSVFVDINDANGFVHSAAAHRD
ncbi:MAG: hypothetical protein HY286_12310 [Planctomycetes bacterium]|nr:hypothetical protein [Planctomycetota bacterium]